MSIGETLRQQLFELEDTFFDAASGIDTRGRIPGENLRTASSFKSHATAYQAVWCRNIRKLLSEAEKHGFNGDFIDVGCGKGKACFFASRFGFRTILGIDFDDELIRIAEENRLRFIGDRSNIRFQHSDAAEFLVPESRTVVFMFNPFDAVIMDKFVRNNIDSLRRHRSMIAYANDRESSILQGAGMERVFAEPARKLSLWRI